MTPPVASMHYHFRLESFALKTGFYNSPQGFLRQIRACRLINDWHNASFSHTAIPTQQRLLGRPASSVAVPFPNA